MMTSAQLTALKNDIIADGVLNALPKTDDSALAISNAFNALASPAYIVWRTDITPADLKRVMDWTVFVARSVPQIEAFKLLIADGVLNASVQNNRDAFLQIFSGTGAAATLRTTLLNLAKRSATRAEKLFATGNGTDATPSIMGFEGLVTIEDVRAAR